MGTCWKWIAFPKLKLIFEPKIIYMIKELVVAFKTKFYENNQIDFSSKRSNLPFHS